MLTTDLILVHLCVAAINFLASILQGLSGFGDGVILQVLWYLLCTMDPDLFLTTPLGSEPVKTVALLMYVRVSFFAPLVAFLSTKDGILSWTMVVAMAVPNCICAAAGVYLFHHLNEDALKRILGISSLCFAVVYIFILSFRATKNWQGKGDAAQTESIENNNNNNSREQASRASTVSENQEVSAVHPIPRLQELRNNINNNDNSPVKCVRKNRNLDKNGKIKNTTKMGAAVASAFSGIMGSLTGVGAPPQVIFILLFKIPKYIIKVNFAAQSLPGALIRFGLACYTPLFHVNQISYFVVSLIFGYAGIYAGNKVGKLLGPFSYNVFVLSVLLLSSSIMLTENFFILVLALLACTGTTLTCGYKEYKKMKRSEKKNQVVASSDNNNNNNNVISSSDDYGNADEMPEESDAEEVNYRDNIFFSSGGILINEDPRVEDRDRYEVEH